MEVGRKSVGGKAITISNVDSVIPEKVLKEIGSLSQMETVNTVNL